MQLQTPIIIRNRGQLTIPDSIRIRSSWMSPGSVVTISQINADEIVIRPHSIDKAKVDWKKLWRNIMLTRSYKGTYTGSLSDFVVSDRENRR